MINVILINLPVFGIYRTDSRDIPGQPFHAQIHLLLLQVQIPDGVDVGHYTHNRHHEECEGKGDFQPDTEFDSSCWHSRSNLDEPGFEDFCFAQNISARFVRDLPAGFATGWSEKYIA